MVLLVVLSVLSIWSVSIGSSDRITEPSRIDGARAACELIFTSLLPMMPSVPIEAMAFCLIYGFTLVSITITTNMELSSARMISFTVPTLMPLNRTLFPGVNPLTVLMEALIVNVFPNRLRFFPII